MAKEALTKEEEELLFPTNSYNTQKPERVGKPIELYTEYLARGGEPEAPLTWSSAGDAASRGVLNAAEATTQLPADYLNFVYGGLLNQVVGEEKSKEIMELANKYYLEVLPRELAEIKEEIPKSTTGPTELIEGVSQAGVGMAIPGKLGTTLTKNLIKSGVKSGRAKTAGTLAAGAGEGGLSYQGKDEGLIDLTGDFKEERKEPIVGRALNAAEGLGIGGVFEAVVRGYRFLSPSVNKSSLDKITKEALESEKRITEGFVDYGVATTATERDQAVKDVIRATNKTEGATTLAGLRALQERGGIIPVSDVIKNEELMRLGIKQGPLSTFTGGAGEIAEDLNPLTFDATKFGTSRTSWANQKALRELNEDFSKQLEAARKSFLDTGKYYEDVTKLKEDNQFVSDSIKDKKSFSKENYKEGKAAFDAKEAEYKKYADARISEKEKQFEAFSEKQKADYNKSSEKWETENSELIAQGGEGLSKHSFQPEAFKFDESTLPEAPDGFIAPDNFQPYRKGFYGVDYSQYGSPEFKEGFNFKGNPNVELKAINDLMDDLNSFAKGNKTTTELMKNSGLSTKDTLINRIGSIDKSVYKDTPSYPELTPEGLAKEEQYLGQEGFVSKEEAVNDAQQGWMDEYGSIFNKDGSVKSSFYKEGEVPTKEALEKAGLDESEVDDLLLGSQNTAVKEEIGTLFQQALESRGANQWMHKKEPETTKAVGRALSSLTKLGTGVGLYYNPALTTSLVAGSSIPQLGKRVGANNFKRQLEENGIKSTIPMSRDSNLPTQIPSYLPAAVSNAVSKDRGKEEEQLPKYLRDRGEKVVSKYLQQRMGKKQALTEAEMQALGL